MATTSLIPLHVNKGKTVAQTLFDRTEYAKNIDKTKDTSQGFKSKITENTFEPYPPFSQRCLLT